MKRCGFLLLVALLAIFAACGDDDEDIGTTPTPSQANSSQVTQPPVTVAPTATANTNCPEPSGDTPEPNMKTFSAAPSEDTIDPSKTYIATVNTVRGEFKIKLRPDLAPKHVASFVFLANEQYFDGVTFHRVLPGFMAQAGDPTGTGSGGPGYYVPGEFTNDVKYARGTVGMARLGVDSGGIKAEDSAGSQWFVTYGATPNLDGLYTIFGEVTDGMEVVDCITPRDPNKNPNAPPGDKIISMTIEVQ
jgi:cyclophilin family peptidyl-prolyl cis-trans isomerase